MILTADIGNTNIALGFFKENTLLEKFYILENKCDCTNYEKVLKSKLSDINVSGCIISSVNKELTPIIVSSIQKILDITPIIVSTNINLGIKINSKTPEKIGTDRISNVVAASQSYSKPAIVVDAGSATTFDIIDENCIFIGGIIMPGLCMQLKSLSHNTSKLPEVNLNNIQKVNTVINIDTEKAILSGVVNGHISAIKGLLESCKLELRKEPIIIGTGGNARIIEKYSSKKLFDIVDEDLTLNGLNILYKLNQ